MNARKLTSITISLSVGVTVLTVINDNGTEQSMCGGSIVIHTK